MTEALPLKRLKFLGPERARFRAFSEREKHLDLEHEKVILNGFQLYFVEDWVWSPNRFYETIVLRTKNDEDKVVFSLLKAAEKIPLSQRIYLQNIFTNKAMLEKGIRGEELSEGIVLLGTKTIFPEKTALRLLHIPHGDYEYEKSSLYSQMALKRVGLLNDSLCLRGDFLPLCARFSQLLKNSYSLLPLGKWLASSSNGLLRHPLFPTKDLSSQDERPQCPKTEMFTAENISEQEEEQKKAEEQLDRELLILVQMIQYLLMWLHHFPFLAPIDGIYGELTVSSTKRFQTEHNEKLKQKPFDPENPGLLVDGLLDPRTVECLLSELSVNIALMKENGFVDPELTTDEILLNPLDFTCAIKNMQKSFGISPDGVFGGKTLLNLSEREKTALTSAPLEDDAAVEEMVADPSMNAE